MLNKYLLALAAVFLAGAGMPRGFAGVVMLQDGNSIAGTVMLVGTGEPRVSVQSPGKATRTFKLSEVRAAAFDPRAGDVGSREADGVPWSRTEVGDGKKAGAADINGAKVAMQDGSDGFHIGRSRKPEETPYADSCCFVFQKLEGDGEIVARVLPSDATRWMRAGLMICEGLEGTGPMALVSRTADPVEPTLISRGRHGEPIATTPDARNLIVAPAWLKLARANNVFKAYASIDGVKWTQLGPDKKILMDDKKGVYIGVAATGNARDGSALFEAIKLTGKRSVPGVNGVGDSRLPDIAVMLHDGTVLAGRLDSITSTNEARFTRRAAATALPAPAPPPAPGEAMTLPVSTLARAQFATLTRAQTEKFLTSPTGMLTRDGDFLEGDIKEVKPDSVTVSSVTFGLTTMDRARVFGIVFPGAADNKTPAGAIEFRLYDGSVVIAKKATLDKEQLILDEPLLGEMRLPVKDIVSMEPPPG